MCAYVDVYWLKHSRRINKRLLARVKTSRRLLALLIGSSIIFPLHALSLLFFVCSHHTRSHTRSHTNRVLKASAKTHNLSTLTTVIEIDHWYWFAFYLLSEQLPVIFVLVMISPWRPAQRDHQSRRLEAFEQKANETSSLLGSEINSASYTF